MDENWLSVPGYEGYYEVSDLGRVRSLDRTFVRSDGHMARCNGRLLKPYAVRGPNKVYLAVELWKDGKGARWKIHHLVLLAFIGPRPEGMWACHHDDDETNNTLTNLRWDTPEANIQDAKRNWQHGKSSQLRPCCAKGHEYTDENTRIYKGKRICRKCRYIIAKKRRERERSRVVALSP